MSKLKLNLLRLYDVRFIFKIYSTGLAGRVSAGYTRPAWETKLSLDSYAMSGYTAHARVSAFQCH